MKFFLVSLSLIACSSIFADSGRSYAVTSSSIQIPLYNQTGETLVTGGVYEEGSAYCGTGDPSTASTCTTCTSVNICENCQCYIGNTGAQWLTLPYGSSITLTYTTQDTAATTNLTFVYNESGVYSYISNSAPGFAINGETSGNIPPEDVNNPYANGQFSVTYSH